MLPAIQMAGTAEAIQMGVNGGLDPKTLSSIMIYSSLNLKKMFWQIYKLVIAEGRLKKAVQSTNGNNEKTLRFTQ
ncbi:MAG: 3-hydroxyisobutyrate dehydrogenase-like beta-hydroxyacid dehydrogenase [Pseudohongiellaceae bacterium]|jgi:3-hydroxyisobutyrate dehydrogenase-like beta-hydroxyacid dehydrogenase